MLAKNWKQVSHRFLEWTSEKFQSADNGDRSRKEKQHDKQQAVD